MASIVSTKRKVLGVGLILLATMLATIGLYLISTRRIMGFAAFLLIIALPGYFFISGLLMLSVRFNEWWKAREELKSGRDARREAGNWYEKYWRPLGQSMITVGIIGLAIVMILSISEAPRFSWNHPLTAAFVVGFLFLLWIGPYLTGPGCQHRSDAYQQIRNCRKAVRINSDDDEAFSNMGKAYAKLGRHQEAVAAYKRAVQLNPGNTDAHFSLGTALLALGNRAAALEQHKVLKAIDKDRAKRLWDLLV